MSTFRNDAPVSLPPPVELPNGWLKVSALIARSGILEYPRADGTIFKEYRPPQEAFEAMALESFASVPLTNDHPPEGSLTAKNTREYQVGTVSQPKQSGDFVRAEILITDAKAIADAKGGKVQLSCGYSCTLLMEPGEIDGQRYDAVQTQIRANHVALVNEGRAGPSVRLRADRSDTAGMNSAQLTEFMQQRSRDAHKPEGTILDGLTAAERREVVAEISRNAHKPESQRRLDAETAGMNSAQLTELMKQRNRDAHKTGAAQ